MNRYDRIGQRSQNKHDDDKRQPGGGGSGGNDQKQRERPKKESIIDLSKYLGKTVRVKFQGGREAEGKLKGYDHLLNLVLEETIEYPRENEESTSTGSERSKRELGLVVCRGPAVTIVCPQDGYKEMEVNPFLSAN